MKHLVASLLFASLMVVIPLEALGSPEGVPYQVRGNYWRYSFSGDVAAPWGVGGGGDITLHVQRDRTVTVVDVGPGASVVLLDVTHLHASGSMRLGDPAGAQLEIALRLDMDTNVTRTLAPAEADEGTVAGVFALDVSHAINGEVTSSTMVGTYGAAVTTGTWGFPLAVGARARVTSQGFVLGNGTMGSLNSTFTITTDYSLGPIVQVDVPSGHYTTLAVDARANGTVDAPQGGLGMPALLPGLGNVAFVRGFFSPDVGYFAKVEYYDARGARLMEDDLVSYHAIPPLGATASVYPGGLVTAPFTAHFNATVTGGAPPYSFRWDFGDGSNSTERNPIHTYFDPGERQATLTVRDASGQAVLRTVDLTTQGAPAPAGPPAGLPPPSILWLLPLALIGGLGIAVWLGRHRRSP